MPSDHGDVDTLLIDGEVVSMEEYKAAALAPIFFPSLPPSRDSYQVAIDLYGPHTSTQATEILWTCHW